ncbi:MAG: ATP-binding cassette domain-containing protein, partial [Acidimicrobiia bacterium]|nr:ATP-binding cassette domain-containing protein [Acidimicrobiia bacterium]
MSAGVQVIGVSRRFGRKQAIADVTFDLEAGEVLGLLGPNGAGKTTT